MSGEARTMSKEILRDVLGLVGAGLVGAGGWMHYPPLGLAAGGAMLFGLAVMATLRGGPS